MGSGNACGIPILALKDQVASQDCHMPDDWLLMLKGCS